MIACVDVDYRGDEAVAGCVLLQAWAAVVCSGTQIERVPAVEPYEPGQFFRRELPCVLAVLAKVRDSVEVVVVDGYVWLGSPERPGLGAHLYEALGGRPGVVGVAKTPYAGATGIPVQRGGSRKPLLVTAVGIDPNVAARHIRAMHGPYRFPSALKLVDQLCRHA
jgi:deoxyribonuclease V